MFALEKPGDIVLCHQSSRACPEDEKYLMSKVFLISCSTACRHNGLFKSRNGIGHLELGMWKNSDCLRFQCLSSKAFNYKKLR